MPSVAWNWLILLAAGVSAIHGQAPTVSVLPEVLWGPQGGNVTRNIVETAVIQLYCSGSGTAILDITWTKDGTTLTNDPPHRRIRISSTNTSVLTIDNFGSADNGEYTCVVTGSTGLTSSSGTLNLTVLGVKPSRLAFLRQPNSQEGNPSNTVTMDDDLTDNRTAVSRTVTEVDPSGTSAGNRLLRCDCGHEDPDAGFPAPSVVWVRDGVELVHDGTKIIISTSLSPDNERRVSDLQILNFNDSDGGVIQCIYTDNDSDAEIFPSIPHRLDRGESLVLRRVTSERTVVLDLPEKLVLEVESSGAYARLNWERNAETFSSVVGAGFPATPDRFINFYETYVRDPTNTSDLGVYEVTVVLGNFVQNMQQAEGFEFVVIPYVLPSTTSNQATVVINEGESINVSCSAVGIPTPTIGWRIRGALTRFQQTDVTQTEHAWNLDGNNVFSYTDGSVTSTLHIINAVYPDDDGVFECVGVNSYRGMNRSTSDAVTVELQYAPEVTVRQLQDPVVLGTSAQLTCSAIGSPPITYKWVQVGKEEDILNTDTTTGDFSLLITDISQYGTYLCIACNNAGMDSTPVVIVQAVPPATSENQEFSYFVGELLMLSVNITTFNLPLTTLTWTLDGTQLQNTDRITISNSNHTMPPVFSMLTVDPVESAGDGGIYTFTAMNPAGQSVTTFTITVYATTTSVFQLRLQSISSDCVDWVEENSDEKATDVISNVVGTVRMECSCNFTAGNIKNYTLSCGSSTEGVVFKAEIFYTSEASDYTADDHVGFISDWAQTGPSITIDGEALSIDASCSAQLESFDSEPCNPKEGEEEDEEEKDDEGFDITEYLVIIIVGGAGIIVLMLFVITLVLVGVLVCLRRRKKRFRLKLKAEAAADLATCPTNPVYGKTLLELDDYSWTSIPIGTGTKLDDYRSIPVGTGTKLNDYPSIPVGTNVAYFKKHNKEITEGVYENTYDEPHI